MRQLIQNYRTGKLEVNEVPSPRARAGGLVVANHFSLISAGTEKASANVARKNLVGKAMERPDLVQKVLGQVKKKGLIETAKMVFSRLDTPVAPGYSSAGIVLEVGREVEGFKVGDRVACAGQNYASHAEVVFIPKNLCVKVPEGVDLQDASYVALGAIAIQGIRQAEPQLGEVVGVIGLGLLGQLTVQMLAANGCTVIGTDIDPGKLEIARKCGAIAVAPEQVAETATGTTGGQGVDAVIITASTKDDGPVTTAAEICRKRGRVIVVGAVGMNLPREPFYMKEIDFRLSTSYGPGRYDPGYEEGGKDYPLAYVRWTEQRNMQAFLELIKTGRIDTRVLTTHSLPIERAAEAYDLILENREPYLGITLAYDRPSEVRTARRVEVAKGAATKAVRVGLIGAGNHVSDMLLPHLVKRADVTIRAVCTGTGMKAKALAAKVGAAFCANDYSEVLADSEVNAVLIGTRHNTHGQMVVAALNAGKHVFVEKPLCLTEAELEEVLAAYGAAAAKGQQLMVGFNRRYSAHALKVKELFSGRMNPLVMNYRVNAGEIDGKHWVQDRSVGGGRIIGEGCHFVDLMQFVCGGTASTVSSVSIARHDSGITNDQAIISLEFKDGSIGSLVYAAGGDPSMPKERLEVIGSGRSAVLGDFTLTEMYAGGRRETFKTSKQDKGFGLEMDLFCDAIIDGKIELPGIDEIEAVSRACILADQALITGERYAVDVTSQPVRV
ncbi:MAG: Inositol 2-dehydrogenase/D-chiro-inositol 3-dehydrogenase [Gammaproteobacteria bacterium]|nr:Inositol 2-dehydrogenase/D-chiro-inositol 3-dehydrogenase [Gammaproteobacteria bacterium]